MTEFHWEFIKIMLVLSGVWTLAIVFVIALFMGAAKLRAWEARKDQEDLARGVDPRNWYT